MTIHYTIAPKDLAAHLFYVTVTVDEPNEEGQIFQLPAWIPGSYMVREFAKNIVQIVAKHNGKKVPLNKLDKHTWQAPPVNGALTLEYEVYAWDLSVRTAHVDQSHGFFNGTSVFLSALGHEYLPHSVDIQRPLNVDNNRWRVATSLPTLQAKQYGFGTYIAQNYDELIDHPVEMGEFQLISFTAHNVPHDFVLTGHVPNVDLARIAADLTQICSTQIAFFEPKTKRAPMSRYVFMTMAVGEGYGGLEHRASTALICNRADLPVKGNAEKSAGYINFLGLCSHEYFHTWNVKRIKPDVFANYDLTQENYTPLLWLFEGFTSYYDDLMLVRSGIIDEQHYLKLVAKTLNGVLRGAGRSKQSLAESSFDAWTKYYRQDENSPNAIVSYYTKGALLALALDLTLRQATQGQKSLDDVMRQLWQKVGKNFYTLAASGRQQGVTSAQVEALVSEMCGSNQKPFFDRYVRGTNDVPLAMLLADFGVSLIDKRNASVPSLGVKLTRDGNDCKLAHVYLGKAAHVAGLSAGDVLVAIDGLRVTAADVSNDLSRLLSRYKVGATLDIYAFRRDELRQFKLKLQADDVPHWAFEVVTSHANNELVKAKKTSSKALKQPTQSAYLKRPSQS